MTSDLHVYVTTQGRGYRAGGPSRTLLVGPKDAVVDRIRQIVEYAVDPRDLSAVTIEPIHPINVQEVPA